MHRILDIPYVLFLPFCLITFVISKFWFGGITINIKDTYYAISNQDLSTLISILFGIIGGVVHEFSRIFIKAILSSLTIIITPTDNLNPSINLKSINQL